MPLGLSQLQALQLLPILKQAQKYHCRATLASYQTSQPKLTAVARAAVTGQDEVQTLRAKVKSLETENQQLRQWKVQRLWVEDHLQDYSMEDLKQRARDNQLAVGGTKLQLLQRLVDTGVVIIAEH